MLGIFGSPQWRTVTGGSREYVTRLAAGLADVRTGTKVTSVLETPDGVEVTDGNGEVTTYDAVVVATHPGQALAMLAEPTPVQREVLGAMPYSANTALLHTDTRLLPRAERARASWNFRRPPGARGQVTVTYDLTRLQRLDTDTRYLVTLGGEDLVDPATVIDRMEYEHPLYTPASVAAQRRLPEIDTDRIAFAGAYHGWGFHEDGARSGVVAAERLGLSWPEPPATTGTPVPDVGGRGRVYRTTIRHTRRTPFRRTFEHTSRTWLVDLDDLPDSRAAGHVRGPRPPRRPGPLAPRQRRGVPRPGGGRGAAGPDPDGRARPGARLLLQPDQRVLVPRPATSARSPPWSRCTTPTATGTPTSSTPTSRAARPPPRRCTSRRSTAPTAPTTSPCRCPATASTSRSPCAPTTARSSAPPSPGRAPTRGPGARAPAALRGTLLIRAHGIWLWVRRLPVRPRPRHHQEGVS